MSGSRKRSILNLVGLIGLTMVVALGTACTHWSGNGGGHHASGGVGYGNCESLSPAASDRPLSILVSERVSPSSAFRSVAD